jgi:hypothetical protein
VNDAVLETLGRIEKLVREIRMELAPKTTTTMPDGSFWLGAGAFDDEARAASRRQDFANDLIELCSQIENVANQSDDYHHGAALYQAAGVLTYLSEMVEHGRISDDEIDAMTNGARFKPDHSPGANLSDMFTWRDAERILGLARGYFASLDYQHLS